MRILVILDAGDEQPQKDGRSAVRLETFLTAYYTLRDANAELVLASPAGGYPFELRHRDREDSTPVLQRFRSDRVAREEVADTLGTDQIFASDFDAALCIGATDPSGQDATAALIAALLASGKPVAIMADAVKAASHEARRGLLIITGSPEAAVHALLQAAQPGRGS